MESYKEYPIRCITCNEQIACYSYIYESLISNGMLMNQALDFLNIKNPCSRIAMMNPVIVTYNMENRQVIEGLKNINDASEDDITPLSSKKIFGGCLGQDIKKKKETIIQQDKIKLKDQKISEARNILRRDDLGEPIALNASSVDDLSFKYPKAVGMLTINRDFGIKEVYVDVGNDKSIAVLNGRTYLAQ